MLLNHLSTFHQFAELMWGTELRFTLKVTFDPERSLSQGLRHVVTPVRLSYYKTYQEDKDGNVITKDSFFSKPLVSVSFKVKIPGIGFLTVLYGPNYTVQLLPTTLAYNLVTTPLQHELRRVNQACNLSTTLAYNMVTTPFRRELRRVNQVYNLPRTLAYNLVTTPLRHEWRRVNQAYNSRIQPGYDTLTTRIVSCKSSLQLA